MADPSTTTPHQEGSLKREAYSEKSKNAYHVCRLLPDDFIWRIQNVRIQVSLQRFGERAVYGGPGTKRGPLLKPSFSKGPFCAPADTYSREG